MEENIGDGEDENHTYRGGCDEDLVDALIETPISAIYWIVPV